MLWTSLLLWLILRFLPRAISEATKAQAEAFRDVRLKELVVLDKTIALLSVGDVISFQQVQAMNQAEQYTTSYDPSEDGEISRIHEREGERDGLEEQMDASERAFLEDLQPGLGIPGYPGQ